MNRKSAGSRSDLAPRKSIRSRDSQIPSAGVPSSARRGLANRTVIDAARNSVGGGRVSFYTQVNQKDPRVMNDEFIQRTFSRIRDFLVQRRLNSEIVPSTNKLTLRQFENMLVTLFRFIDPTYNPPSGNQWLEHEVPILMDGYPHKVTKSMMQTVSSKPGPVVGILDYLLDLATAMECDPAEAIRLLSKEDGALQVETEELARSSFVKGLPVASPQLKEQVLDLCTRHKGIMDEAGIRAERERVRSAQQEAEAALQLLEEQLAERDSVEEEYQQLVEYLEQMKSRETSKKLDLERMHEEKTHLTQKIIEIDQLIGQTKTVVEGQPISVEEIRSMRTQSTELEDTRSSVLSNMRSTESELELVSSSVRTVKAELETVCGEISQLLDNGPWDGLRNFGRNDLIEAARKADEATVLLREMTQEFDLLSKK
ncbi:kinetochore protein NDC80-like, partial [Tropilaelaps mercedesae]